MLKLALSLDLALVVALDCFFPWELCASLTVPGYSFPQAILTHYASGGFQWFLTPVELASKAEPPIFYYAGLLVALPLFVILPPAALLATYLPGLVELERLAQEIKASERQT